MQTDFLSQTLVPRGLGPAETRPLGSERAFAKAKNKTKNVKSTTRKSLNPQERGSIRQPPWPPEMAWEAYKICKASGYDRVRRDPAQEMDLMSRSHPGPAAL